MSTSGSPAAPKPTKPRAKGWLLAFAIAAIAIGALDVFSGLSTAAAPALLRGQAKLVAGMGDEAAARAQTEMFEKVAAVYDRHRTAVTVGAVARPLVGAILIIAGIGGIRLRRWGRRLLIGAFAATAIVAAGLGPELVRLQREVAAENAAQFERTMRAVGETEAGRQVSGVMTSVMQTTGAAATITAIGLIVLVSGICVAGAIFLLHPRTGARFEASA
jgi:hypothetical protein